jgi:hypothetical protein
MNYAGIGSRQTPPDIIKIMEDIATLMAIDGHICNTGAARGADQAFANGANKVRGPIELFLPWGNYEAAWVATLHNKNITVFHDKTRIKAAESVHKYHPGAAKLTQGAFKLHARNYLIIEGCRLIICWTVGGQPTGGTGQAIRLSTALGIPVMNLGNPETLARFIERINARKKEIDAYTKHSAPE